MDRYHYAHSHNEQLDMMKKTSKAVRGGEKHGAEKRNTKSWEKKRELSVEVGGITGSEWVGVWEPHFSFLRTLEENAAFPLSLLCVKGTRSQANF